MAMTSERVRRIAAGAAGVLIAWGSLAPIPARAETELGPAKISGEVEAGARFVWGDEDAAKFQEYRDFRDYQALGRFDLLFENDQATWWSRIRGENIGYRDQRYWFEGGRYGRFTIDAFYGELPHVFSVSARTPYLDISGNTFVTDLDLANQIAAPFLPIDQKLQWREGRIGGNYHVGESGLLRASYRIQDKEGRRNWGMNFGSPGGSFTSIPARIDERIHEARVGADWMLGNGSISAEWLGNFFQNDFNAVVADNPRVTDRSPGELGRAAAAPDNWAQSLSLAGAASLPLDVPNRVSASFVYGFRRQDDNFLPHTINQGLPGLPSADLILPSNNLDGQVQTILGNLFASVRPTQDVSAKLRYRIYDFDNLTDPLVFPGNVRNDGTLREGDPHVSVASDYTRQDADLDLSWDFAQGWTGGLGFGWEYWNRSYNREVEDLHEYGPTLTVDYRTLGGTLLHAGYEFRNRDGSNYDALAPLTAVVGGPQVCAGNTDKFCGVRKFDEANRYLHRFDVLAKFVPAEPLELSFTGSVDYADYHDTDYGLSEALGWHVGSDAYLELHPRVAVLGYYTYEWRMLWQDSRQRSPNIPGVEGPDWSSKTRYQYHNIGSSLRLAVLPERLDAELGYILNFGQEKTRASGEPAVSAGATQLPAVSDTLQALYGTLAYHLSESMTLRTGYRLEDYNIDNFRDDNVPLTLTDGNNLYLGDIVGDYLAHIFEISAVLRF